MSAGRDFIGEAFVRIRPDTEGFGAQTDRDVGGPLRAVARTAADVARQIKASDFTPAVDVAAAKARFEDLQRVALEAAARVREAKFKPDVDPSEAKRAFEEIEVRAKAAAQQVREGWSVDLKADDAKAQLKAMERAAKEAAANVRANAAQEAKEAERVQKESLSATAAAAKAAAKEAGDAFRLAGREAADAFGTVDRQLKTLGPVNVQGGPEAAASVRGIGRAADESDGHLGRLGLSLGNILKLAATAGAAFAGFKVAEFFKDSTKASSDLNESVSKVGVVFGPAAGEIKAFAATAATALGQSTQQVLEATGTFGNLFTAMGLGKPAAADMSTALVTLAGDLASFNNANPEDVLIALKAGLVGETEPMRQFGVNLNEATIKAKALSAGLVTATSDTSKVAAAQIAAQAAQNAYNAAVAKYGKDSAEAGLAGQKLALAQDKVAEATSKVVMPDLTAAQKAQAAYLLIMEQTTTAQGDFARTADGVANAGRTVKATFEDLKAAAGAAILTPLSGAMAGLRDILPTLAEPLKALGGAIGSSLGSLFQVIRPLFDLIGRLAPVLRAAIAAVAPFLGQLVGSFADLVAGVGPTIELLADHLAPVLGGIGEIVGFLVAPLVSIVAGIGNLVNAALPLLDVGISLLSHFFLPVADAIGKFAFALTAALVPVLLKLTPVFDTLVPAFSDLGLAFADALVSLIPLIPPLVDLLLVFTPLVPLLAQIVEALVPFAPLILDFAVAFKVASVAASLFEGVMVALEAVMLANPFVLIGVAVAAVVVGLVYAYQHSERFRAVVDAIGRVAKAAGVWLAGAAVSIGRFAAVVARDIGGAALAVGRFGERVREDIVGAFGAVERFGGRVLDFVRNIPGRVVGGLGSTVDVIVGFFTGLPARIGSALSSAGGALRAAGINLLADVIANSIIGAETLFAFVASIPQRILDIITGGAGVLTTVGADVARHIVDGIRTGVVLGLKIFTDLPGTILDIATKAIPTLVLAGGNLMVGFYNGIVAGAKTVIAYLTGIPKTIFDFFAGSFEFIKTAGSNLMVGFYNGVLAGARTLFDFIKGIPQSIWDVFEAWYQNFVTLGRNILVGIVNGVLSFGGAVLRAIGNLITDLISAVKSRLGIASPSKVFADIGQNMMKGLAVGVAAGAAAAQNAVVSAITIPDTPALGVTIPGQDPALGIVQNRVADDTRDLLAATVAVRAVLDRWRTELAAALTGLAGTGTKIVDALATLAAAVRTGVDDIVTAVGKIGGSLTGISAAAADAGTAAAAAAPPLTVDVAALRTDARGLVWFDGQWVDPIDELPAIVAAIGGILVNQLPQRVAAPEPIQFPTPGGRWHTLAVAPGAVVVDARGATDPAAVGRAVEGGFNAAILQAVRAKVGA